MEGHAMRPESFPRPSVSLTDLRLRTPIVENLLSMLPMGHDKALKYAFYNVLALVVACAVVLAFWGVYCILEPFIKSLLWALLCGSVLHPFKDRLCRFARSWLKSSRKTTTPFTLRLLASPFKIVDTFSDKIGTYVVLCWKSILSAVVVFFVTYVVYYNPPVALASAIQVIVTSCFGIFVNIIGWANGHVVIALNTIYVITICHFTFSSKKTEKEDIPSEQKESESPNEDIPPRPASVVENLESNGLLLKSLSYLNWTLSFAYLCRLLPYSLLIALFLFTFVGVVAYLRGRTKSMKYSLPTISRYACLMVLNIGSGNAISLGSPTIFGKSDNSRGMKSAFDVRSGSSSAVKKIPLQRSLSVGAKSEDIKYPPQQSQGIQESEKRIIEEQESIEQEPSFYAEFTQTDLSPVNEDEVEGLLMIDSNKFLYGVMCACLVVQMWNRLWLFHLIPIPIAYYGIKKLFTYFGISISGFIQAKIVTPFLNFYNDPEGPGMKLFPEPIRIALKIMYIADKKLVGICEASLDPVASSLILVIVVMATILGIIFASIQVYAEGDHLVRVGVDLVNSTVSKYPEINAILPDGWQGVMGSMVGNAYLYGREYITNTIRDTIAEKNPEKAEQIEKQVIELWDKIYLGWNQTWDNVEVGTENNGYLSAAVYQGSGSGANSQHGIEWDQILETGKKMPHLLEFSVLANYAKANVGTLWSVLESLWNILIGNISLAFSAVTATMSLLFGGGTAILNLIINLVVFFTSLFYLLSASTSVYKPVELFNAWSPGTGVLSSSFAIAVEEAINGVFMASFKMAAFYGMWTWLIHTLFQVNIVFVPAIFGALFAAVPFLMPYWAAFPAVLELWLIQGHWSKALLMMLAQMAPMSAVDTQIYSEIKGGGHPYLTGLAVAGGIFCFGVQGAIMGPVILCCVFVAVKIGSSFLKENVETETIRQNTMPSED